MRIVDEEKKEREGELGCDFPSQRASMIPLSKGATGSPMGSDGDSDWEKKGERRLGWGDEERESRATNTARPNSPFGFEGRE